MFARLKLHNFHLQNHTTPIATHYPLNLRKREHQGAGRKTNHKERSNPDKKDDDWVQSETASKRSSDVLDSKIGVYTGALAALLSGSALMSKGCFFTPDQLLGPAPGLGNFPSVQWFAFKSCSWIAKSKTPHLDCAWALNLYCGFGRRSFPVGQRLKAQSQAIYLVLASRYETFLSNPTNASRNQVRSLKIDLVILLNSNVANYSKRH